MRERVRAIIFSGDDLVLIKRIRSGREPYWTFPGGVVNKSENHAQALERECMEELGMKIKVGALFWEGDLDIYKEKQKQYYYLCEIISGQIGTGQGPEFAPDKDIVGWGTHQVVTVPKAKIVEINLLPKEVKNRVIEELIH